MNKGTLLLFLLLASLTPLSARLGESEAELVKRFGKIVTRQPERMIEQGKFYDVGERLVFKSDQWRIGAVLIKGRCEKIEYAKPGEWAEAQFTTLLTSNAGKYSWREIRSPLPKAKRDWARDDGAVASWIVTGGFSVSSPAFSSTVEEIKRAAKVEATKAPKF